MRRIVSERPQGGELAVGEWRVAIWIAEWRLSIDAVAIADWADGLKDD
jgi:hypothetical protein